MLTHIETASGFAIDIDEKAMDDMEVFELVFAIEDGDMKAYLRLADKIMGSEGKKRLYEHLRTEGRVPVESFGRELTEILKGLQSAKK